MTVAHDAIDDVMPAMAMPLSIRGTAPILAPNDRITATLVVTADASWLEDVVVAQPGDGGPRLPAPGLAATLVGTTVPDFRLRNHDDRPLSFESYRGRVVMVTFIYTRCPLPDYCPRLMRYVNDVKRVLDTDRATRDRVRYLAVSFDPTYDTPAVLKAYGQRFISGPAPFSTVDLATGTATEVQAMAGFFGVKYLEDSSQISHSLSTAIVGADGRVTAVFPSNTWAPDDAVAAIRVALGRSRARR